METTSSNSGGRLDLVGIQKRFGEHTAIDRLDMVVRPGEFLSLLGPSGCGKTTLLRMIAGFEQPTRGRIELGGKDLVGLPPHRRPVNTVFQSYALFPHMSVADNVAYGLKQVRTPRRQIVDRVVEALGMVRMEGFSDRKPDQLSGGQQQRVALARALVNRPRVLLLDEPMSALDRKLREEMQLELQRLHSDLGTTFVFVTHDQEEALAMSDRIAVMEGGRIQQLGTAEEIYSAPANRFVAGFIGRQNFFDAVHAGTRGGQVLLRSRSAEFAVPAPSAAGLTEGDRVTAAIRPEALSIAAAETVGAGVPAGDGGTSALAPIAEPWSEAHPEATAATASADASSVPDRRGSLRGRVIGTSFLGDVVQHLVRVEGEGAPEVLVRGAAFRAPALEDGAAVTLSWAPESVRVFGDD